MLGRPTLATLPPHHETRSRMSEPTKEDARLMIQIAQWGTALGVQDAMPRLFAEDFDPDSADANDEAVRTMLMYFESIGTLTKHGLLSEELVHDWLWVGGIWSRVGKAALRQRERYGEPRLYENFEALAKGGG
jgi:hypothetical protein